MRLLPGSCVLLAALSLGLAGSASRGHAQVSVGIAPRTVPAAAPMPSAKARRGSRPTAARRARRYDPNDLGDAASVAARAELQRALLLSGRVALIELEAAGALERQVARASTRDYDPALAPQALRSQAPDFICQVSGRVNRSKSSSGSRDINSSTWVRVGLERGSSKGGVWQERDFGLAGFEPTQIRNLVLKTLREAREELRFRARLIVADSDQRCFLNLGSDAGVREGQVFLVSRDGVPLEEVRVVKVGDSTCEVARAQVQAEVRSGDVATLIR
jgi:hypothetical protein